MLYALFSVSKAVKVPVDHTRLRDLLAAGNWKEADRETFALLLTAASREEEGWLSSESIKNFPYTDLRTETFSIMQVSTCFPQMNKTIRSPALTRGRLIEAATQVFASAGVQGATTREIARVAGVNEVTLFRHFASKEQLLEAVIENVLALQTEALAHPEEWTQDLRLDLRHYAQLYNSMLEAQEDLIRTFIGEAKRHPEAARRVMQDAAWSMKEKLVAYLRTGQTRGTVRLDLDLVPAIDIFIGMLLAGMLRRSAALNLLYSRENYIENCVDIFVRGISAAPL